MWFVEKYMVLKIISRHKMTRYQIQQRIKLYPYTMSIPFSSFYPFFKTLVDSDLVTIEYERVRHANHTQKFPPNLKLCGKIRGYCYLTDEGRRKLKDLETRIKLIVLCSPKYNFLKKVITYHE